MSATPTASEAGARRGAWAPRWLVVLHRYLGVGVGLLMLMWFVSGAVMLFVPNPGLSAPERLAALPRLDWARCCAFGGTVPAGARVSAATIEDLGGAPVLRLRLADGGRRMVELASGHDVAAASAGTARQVASRFCGGCAVEAVAPAARDQWTVSGEFNRDRPLWRVRLADGRGTDVYVSSRSGEAVQATTAAGRALNWVGAVPHWLYPTILRQDGRLWTQVVIWTSLLGAFLTLTGLYLGILAWRRLPDRASPFRGLMLWHHLTGLAAGILTLTWVASGLVSMNPWGFLESPDDPALARIAGPPPAWREVQAAFEAAAVRAPVTTQLRLAPLDGQVFVMAGEQRYDAKGRPAPLGPEALSLAGRRLGPLTAQGWINAPDAYYYPHHEAVTLPAWRVVRADGRRAYLDPRTGEVLAAVDAPRRGYRWLHQGLHRLDFTPGLNRGPAWAGLMLVLLAAAGVGVATGVWLAWRRVKADLAALRR
jgi:uncharacterized iron-regulated membrane protein